MLEDKMKTKKTTELPEEVFFRYASDCIESRVKRGKIGEDVQRKLQQCLTQGICPNKDLLEAAFSDGLKLLKEYSEQHSLNYWSVAAIRDYFIKGHNVFIEQGKGAYVSYPPELKELCKVHVGKIIEKEKKENNTFYVIAYNGRNIKIIGNRVPDAKIGDKVSVHYRMAVEKL